MHAVLLHSHGFFKPLFVMKFTFSVVHLFLWRETFWGWFFFNPVMCDLLLLSCHILVAASSSLPRIANQWQVSSSCSNTACRVHVLPYIQFSAWAFGTGIYLD